MRESLLTYARVCDSIADVCVCVCVLARDANL